MGVEGFGMEGRHAGTGAEGRSEGRCQCGGVGVLGAAEVQGSPGPPHPSLHPKGCSPGTGAGEAEGVLMDSLTRTFLSLQQRNQKTALSGAVVPYQQCSMAFKLLMSSAWHVCVHTSTHTCMHIHYCVCTNHVCICVIMHIHAMCAHMLVFTCMYL